jgi:hypothetical protein
LVENSTLLWSHHTILRSDETWLSEWSGKLGGVQRCAVRSRGVSWGKPVFRLTERKIEFPGSLAWGPGAISARRNEHTSRTEAK